MTDNKRSAANEKSLSAAASPSALLALGIGLMAGATPAVAQDTAATNLGSVTVTDTAIDDSYGRSEIVSDKSTAPLLDTPQTVSVIPQEVIRDRAARTLAEVLRNTPGITFNAGENGFGTSTNNFSLRGFDTSGSVYIDNLRDSGSYARDVFNIESVEVVKGAAADNGRGSAGGYVNINSKTPSFDRFVAGDVSYGIDKYDSEDRKRASVDINQPLGETVAVRLNAVVEDSGVAGRQYAKNKLWGVAPSLAIGLGTNFRAYLSWEHVEREDRPDWGVPGKTIEGLITFNPASADAPRDAYYGLLTDFDDSTSDAITARLELDLADNVTLSSNNRWSRLDRTSRFTTVSNSSVAANLAPTQTLFYDRTNESFSTNANLAARFDTGGLRHTLSVGVEASWEESTAGRFGSAGGAFAPGNTDLFDPNPERVGAAPFNPASTADINVETFAAYIYDTIEIGNHFEITGGVRGESYTAKIRDSSGGAFDNFETSPFVWNGKVGVVYKPTEDGSIYASFGTAALPLGSFLSNPDISRTGDNAFPGIVNGADPIRAHNYEVGIKWDLFDGALSTTAALFRTEKRNVPIVGRATGVTTGPTSLQGYHELQISGIELGLSGQITPEWNVFAGALFMDSKRKITPELAAIQRAANTGDFPGTYSTWAIDGDSLAFTPEFTANLWTTYNFPFGLTLGGGLQHVGSSYLGRPDDALRIIPNGVFGKLPSYTLVNALIGYKLTDNIDLRLNIDNITDEKYALSTNWNGSRASLGSSRSFLLSAGFQF